MDVSQEYDSSKSPRTYFAQELRRIRTGKGITQLRLADIIGWSESQISMVEQGHRKPTRPFTVAVDAAMRLEGRLIELYDMFDSMAAQSPEWFRPWIEVEREAQTLRAWEPLIVPGLLQVEGYARAQLSGEPGVSKERTEELVRARLDRQNIFARPDPPRFWVVLDEGVLARPVGSPEIMAAQIAHLLEVAEEGHISIQILPHSAYNVVGLLGSFVVAELSGAAADMVYVESQGTEGRVNDRVKEVERLRFKHDAIRADAMSRRESLNAIKEMMRRWTA
ncbi:MULTISPECIES: helix-turn-helix domain-containing protein [Streptosporangium]|uniref:Helix-turn-helix transcriptional regulator n=1 Tax=Streptosporangium jomthongense TaxID=1193683 RepID=A0ABV8F762_9ACTN